MCESSPEQQINIRFTKIALRANDICCKVIEKSAKKRKKIQQWHVAVFYELLFKQKSNPVTPSLTRDG